MKTRVFIVLVMAMVLVNCAKKSSPAPAEAPPAVDPVAPYVPPGVAKGESPGSTFIFGGAANFVFENVDVYRQYTGRYIGALSEISNVMINLNLVRFGNSYGGTTTLRYKYQNTTFEGFFTAGHRAEATQYNIWFKKNDKNVWHGFFEDFMGGLIVVLHKTASLDDGFQVGDKVGGTVYFKNFVKTGAPHPPTYCWFVSIGPFDCRAWKEGDGVNTTKAVHPQTPDGYTKLGTFSDLNVFNAFNDDIKH